MKNQKIELSVKRGQFRSDDPTSEEADKQFKSIRPKVLKRDNHTCQYCGFRAEKYQEVHHKDDDHTNNDEDNLITTCSLCHACFHVGFSGQKERGIVIYLDPALGLTQAELNQLVRVLWIGELSEDQSIKMLSINMLARLYKQKVPADRKLGTCDPLVLGDFLLHLEEEDYLKRDSLLGDYFLLPLKEGFGPQLKYWMSGPFKGTPSATWHEIASQKASRWANNLHGESTPESIMRTIGKE